MSFINRPDERKRDAAKLARAIQARPLSESSSSAERDNAFSMITVNNSQLDDISKNVMEILGPYHHVLGRPTNGFRASRNSDFSRAGGGAETVVPIVSGSSFDSVPGLPPPSSTSGHQQPNSKSKQSNSSSVTALPLNSIPSLPAEDYKKQHMLQASVNPSTVSSKSVKSTLIPTSGSNHMVSSISVPSTSLPSHHTAVTSSSSPHSPRISPKNGISSHFRTTSVAPQEHHKGNDSKKVLKGHRSPSSLPLKLESSSAISPMKYTTSKLQAFPNLSSSKSVQPKSSSGQSKNLQDNAALIIPQTNGKSSLSGALNKVYPNITSGHLVKNTSNPTTISPLLDQTSEPTSSSLLTAAISSTHDLPAGQTKPDSLPSSRSHSTAAPSTKDHISPGENHHRSTKPTDSTPTSGRGQVTDKAKLTLKMQNERKTPTSKSDLNDIIKELAELHDPLTAIETPQKVVHGFPFSASVASGKESLSEVLRDGSAKVLQKLAETKLGLEKEVSQRDTAAKAVTEPELVENVALVSNISTAAPEVNQCNNIPDVGLKGASYGSIGNATYDVNSILRRDLDMSEDSDADPAVEDNPVASQPNTTKIKVISPMLGAPVKSAVSPMSSSSSSSSSSESSSEASGEEDDDDEKIEDTNVEVKKSSERRLSSSSSSSSSSSELSSDEDNCAEDDGVKSATDVKTAPDGTPTKAAAERVEKPSLPGAVTSAVMGPQSVSAQDNTSPESGMVWCLKNFIQHPKKSSPSSVSPTKPHGSSPEAHSSPPTVQQKDYSTGTIPAQSCTPPGISRRDTLLFEPQKTAQQNHSYDHADKKDVDNTKEVSNKKKANLAISPKKKSEHSIAISSLERSKQTKNCPSVTVTTSDSISKKDHSKNTQSKSDTASLSNKSSRKSSVSSNLNNVTIKTTSAVSNDNSGKTTKIISPNTGKSLRPRSCSSSYDEIDVVSFTPESKSHDRLGPGLEKSVSDDSRQEVCKKLFNGNLTEKSTEDSKSINLRGKNSPIHDIKHHKRKNEHQSTVTTSTTSLATSKLSSATKFASSTKLSRKPHSDNIIDALENAEATPKPATHSSVGRTAKSSPSIISPKLSAPPHSPATASSSHSPIATKPALITLSTTSDGSNHPQIRVQILNSFLSSKVLKWLKDKKKNRNKLHNNSKLLGNSLNSEVHRNTLNETPTLTVADSKSSSHKKNGSNNEAHSLVAVKVIPEAPELSSSSSSSVHSIQSSKASKHRSSSVVINNDSTSNPLAKKAKSPSKESTPTASSSLESSPPISTSSGRVPAKAIPNLPSVSSQSAANKLTSISPSASEKTLDSNAVNNLDIIDSSVPGNCSRSDKLKALKRKSEVGDEEVSKRSRSNRTRTIDSSTASVPISGGVKGLHKSSSSRRSPQHHSSSINGADANSKSINEAGDCAPNGSDDSLPFVHYVNDKSSSKKMISSNAGLTGSDVPPPSLPADLSPPSIIETQLHTADDYLARAREHKHHADSLRDKLAKYEPYLRSGLSFFLAGYSMEVSKRETSCSIYNDTSNLLQYVIKMRANSSSNPDFNDRERKLIALLIRLQAYLNYRLYRLRRNEANNLRRVIESEQAKLHSSFTTAATTTSSSSANPTTTSKPQAPSPHQSTWTKNSTRTPSPMSPTPSPAGSVSSQGSCEMMFGKVQNGTISSSSTPITSPSPSLVSVQQQTQSYSQRYFLLTRPIVKAMELWELAEAESRTFGEFFAVLDNACGPLSFHSEPTVIVRYMKHALRVLNIMK